MTEEQRQIFYGNSKRKQPRLNPGKRLALQRKHNVHCNKVSHMHGFWHLIFISNEAFEREKLIAEYNSRDETLALSTTVPRFINKYVLLNV